MSNTHSPLGGSVMARVLACPASARICAGLPQEPDSPAAAQGTLAHSLAEHCLRTGEAPWTCIGASGWEEVDKEMADAVEEYISWVDEKFPDRNQSNFWVERKFTARVFNPFFSGSADMVHWNASEKLLTVADYKHGVGVPVWPEWNVQCMYYACGAIEELNLWDLVEEVDLVIVQPRSGGIKTWRVSLPDLKDWLCDTLLPGMGKALVSEETRAGEHCRFCPARFYACPALKKLMKEFEMETQRIKEIGIDALSNAQLAHYLDLYDVAKKIVQAAEQTAFARLSEGQEIPGRKLVAKVGNRQWKPGAEVRIAATFGEHGFLPATIKSPSQIEALPLGKEFAAEWAFKPETGLTIVRTDDRRAEQSPQTKSMFTDLTKQPTHEVKNG